MEVNTEVNNKLQNQWNDSADWYERTIEPSSTSGTITCAVMANMQQAKRTIEVACGPGLHSLMLANTFLRSDGGVLVSCDISDEMVTKVKKNYEKAEWTSLQGNKFASELATDFRLFKEGSTSELVNTCKISDVVASQGEFKKFVYACTANNELMPFEDGAFDSYVAALSLQIVPTPQNMISEAFRILSPGGSACMTVWGSWENMAMFSIGIDVLRKHVPEEMITKDYSDYLGMLNYYHVDKGAKIRQDMEAAGFQNVQIWEQPMNVPLKDGQDFYTKFGKGFCRHINAKDEVTAETKAKIAEDMVKHWDAQNAGTLKSFSVAIVSGNKP